MTKGEETRRRIVQEAAAIFNKHGYEGSSLLDLMRATGLEKGGLYRHFSSKEEIAVAAFRYAWEQVTEARARDLASISSPREKLLRLIANFAEIRNPIPGGCPLMNTAADADDGNPALRELAREALHGMKTRIGSILQAGVRAGEFAAGLDTERTANLVVATLEGALMIARLEHDRRALEDARSFLSAHIESLAPRLSAAKTRTGQRSR